MEKRDKKRKYPIFLGLEEEFFPFVPEGLEYLLLSVFDDQFAALIAKIAQKIEKTIF